MLGAVIFAEYFGFFLDDGLVDGVLRRLVSSVLLEYWVLDYDHVSLLMYYVKTDYYLSLSLELD